MKQSNQAKINRLINATELLREKIRSFGEHIDQTPKQRRTVGVLSMAIKRREEAIEELGQMDREFTWAEIEQKYHFNKGGR